MTSPVEDRGVGALLGVAVGDAAGAPLEFSRPDAAAVDAALRFPGGGPFGVGPGQVTDDTELAMACMTALLAARGSSKPGRELAHLARAYDGWFASGPFDCGTTCRRAFGTMREDASLAGRLQHVKTVNAQSKANGALMRCAPIAVAFHADPPRLDWMATMDARLSHPNPVCVDANKVYCAALGALVRTGDPDEALAIVDREADLVHPEVGEMIRASRRGPPTDCTGHEGHLKWGFVAALAHLRARSSFQTALRQILAAGGDTDTNAAIVGGMMGALWGASGIPRDWKAAVADASENDRHARPRWFSPRDRTHDMRLLCAS